jgi:hypothetical protein
MLDMVAFAPWSRNENLSHSTYVPDSSALYITLSACDDLMLSTDRFTRGHPQWHPFVSRLYMSLIFYFRIMDCMVLSGHADAEVITLLHRIKNSYDFRRLMIPGPLVPHIQAISVASSGHENLGDITPTLPSLKICTGKAWYTLLNGLNPNPLALMDYLQALEASTAANRAEEEPSEVRSLFSVDVSDANLPLNFTVITTAGYGTTTSRIRSELDTFVSARVRLSLPPRLDQSTTAANTQPLNWYQFLRFRPVPDEEANPFFSAWFGRIASVMQDYSAYFRHSTSLGDIPPASGGSPHVLANYVKETDTRLTPIRYGSKNKKGITIPASIGFPLVNTLAATGEVRILGLPEAHRQLGVLSLTNARPAGGSGLRTGDAWTQVPVVDTMTEFNSYRNIPSYVSSLHVSRALE